MKSKTNQWSNKLKPENTNKPLTLYQQSTDVLKRTLNVREPQIHRNKELTIPEGPTDDDVSLDSDTQGAVDRSGLRYQAERVHPRRDEREHPVVVAGEEGVLGVAVHRGKSGKETKKMIHEKCFLQKKKKKTFLLG